MNPCTRPASPQWLEEHWQEWGQEYATKLQQDRRYQFNWKQWKGERVNLRLLPLLNGMTEGHCAYCDCFPMDVGTDATIDHFKPKIQFPEEAYHWLNLYLCCRLCQQKDDAHFHEDLLRPDEDGYRFERYFIYSYRDGTIDANPAASDGDRRRALLTIRHLKLNGRALPTARRRALRMFRDLPEEKRAGWLPDSPFRFVLADEVSPAPHG